MSVWLISVQYMIDGCDRGVIRILLNIYEGAFWRQYFTAFISKLFFVKTLHHRCLTGSWINLCVAEFIIAKPHDFWEGNEIHLSISHGHQKWRVKGLTDLRRVQNLVKHLIWRILRYWSQHCLIITCIKKNTKYFLAICVPPL